MKDDLENVGGLGEITDFDKSEDDDEVEEDFEDVEGFEDEFEEQTEEEKETSLKLRIKDDLPMTAFKMKQQKQNSSAHLEQIAEGEHEGNLEEKLGVNLNSNENNSNEGIDYLGSKTNEDSLYGSGPKREGSNYVPTKTNRLKDTEDFFDHGPRDVYSQSVSELSQGNQIKRERDYAPQTRLKRLDDKGTFLDKSPREYELN